MYYQSIHQTLGMGKMLAFAYMFNIRFGLIEPPRVDVVMVAVSPDFAGVPFLNRLPDLYELWHADVGVDVLCYTPAEFEALRSQLTVVKDAAERGVALI